MSQTLEQRYQTDVDFHHLVDMLIMMIEKYEFTPSEVRHAAIMAATMAELRIAKALFP